VSARGFLDRRRLRLTGREVWAKSSLSSYNTNCVEYAELPDGTVVMRDSKDPRGRLLSFTPAEWDELIAGVRRGEFDRQQ
jgi:hypothetical protein